MQKMCSVGIFVHYRMAVANPSGVNAFSPLQSTNIGLLDLMLSFKLSLPF